MRVIGPAWLKRLCPPILALAGMAGSAGCFSIYLGDALDEVVASSPPDMAEETPTPLLIVTPTPTEVPTPSATPMPVDADGDGSPLELDCDDGDAEVAPGLVEVCGDGKDNDCEPETPDDCPPECDERDLVGYLTTTDGWGQPHNSFEYRETVVITARLENMCRGDVLLSSDTACYGSIEIQDKNHSHIAGYPLVCDPVATSWTLEADDLLTLTWEWDQTTDNGFPVYHDEPYQIIASWVNGARAETAIFIRDD